MAFAAAVPPFSVDAAAASKARVACQDLSGPGFRYLVRPKRCSFTCASCNPDQAGTVLVGLGWERWGAKKTGAAGTFAGNMGYRAQAHIRLRHRVRCDGRRYYSRAWMRISDDPPIRFKLPTPC